MFLYYENKLNNENKEKKVKDRTSKAVIIMTQSWHLPRSMMQLPERKKSKPVMAAPTMVKL